MKINSTNPLKGYVLFLLIICVQSTILSQVTEFKMRDYLYRTPGMRAMAFNASTSASNSANNQFYFSLIPGSSYFKQYSLDNKQLTIWNNCYLNFNRQPGSSFNIPGVTSTATVQRDWRLMLSDGCNWVKRQYKNNNYIEYGTNSMVTLSNSSLKNDPRKLYVLGLNPNIGIGTGRLEYVSNAQMALFILEDLKKAGKIKGTISAEKAYQFTELVTELYNTRIFDFRKRRNYETNKIDSFLTTNKLINGNDFTIYNVIADNWNYAIQPPAIEATSFYSGTLQVANSPVSDRINVFGVLNQQTRYNGQRTSLNLILPSTINNMSSLLNSVVGLPGSSLNIPGLNGSIGFGAETLDSTQKTIVTTQMGYNAILRYENCLAIDVHRQRNFSIYFDKLGLNNNTTVSYKINKADSTIQNKYNITTIGGNYQYCYYPNSRTNMSANLNLNYTVNNNKFSSFSNPTPKSSINLGIVLNANYFINYNSRVNANFSIGTAPISSAGNFKTRSLAFTISYINYLF